MAPKVAFEDPLLGPLTDDRLTRDVRVYQRKKGHRFSSDDVATAYLAHRARPSAQRVLDLGCGLGSVLLCLAWKLPEARLWGVEAQAMSFELLRRNVERAGYAERVRVANEDLRTSQLLHSLPPTFELITGTPPYFPPETALDAEDEQRAYARIEYRGGVEAYIAAAAALLAPGGAFVMCGDSDVTHRTTSAASAHSLFIAERCDVFPRSGRAALFSIWTLQREPPADERVWSMTLRDQDGRPTTDATNLREFSGFDAHSS